MTRNSLIASGLAALLLLGLAFWFLQKPTPVPVPTEPDVPVLVQEIVTEKPSPLRIVGTSVTGRVIEHYTFGTGSTTLLFVGGVHGGYEWNSVLLAYEFIDALTAGTIPVPTGLTITVIPTLNPDGLYDVVKKDGRFTAAEIPENTAHQTGQGRLNANEVDLNRNFACKWQRESTWRNKVVSAGTAAFSEPEAVALRTVVTETKPAAVVFWHSQAGAVYASECEAGILPATLTLMNEYARAADYQAIPSFDAYPITGDAEGWLASIGIPAITVELETRTSSEWERNQAGIIALMSYYTNL